MKDRSHEKQADNALNTCVRVAIRPDCQYKGVQRSRESLDPPPASESNAREPLDNKQALRYELSEDPLRHLLVPAAHFHRVANRLLPRLVLRLLAALRWLFPCAAIFNGPHPSLRAASYAMCREHGRHERLVLMNAFVHVLKVKRNSLRCLFYCISDELFVIRKI